MFLKKNGMANSNQLKISKFNRGLLKGIIIISAILFIILLAFLLGYLFSTCHKKKSFMNYLGDGNIAEPCDKEYPVLNYDIRELEDEKEVFHIENQIYSYKQAQEKCNAYGSRLATKEELIDAYNKGTEFCSYGWIDGQMAYYPTQKCTWDKLQRNPYTRNACGNPGLNGGYFPDNKMRFGATCYGIKPAGEVIKMKKPTCHPKKFCDDPRNKNACNILKSDEIAPFNNNKWSAWDKNKKHKKASHHKFNIDNIF